MQGREVKLPAGPTFPACAGYAATPSGARRGAVVLHEIMGRRPEIDAVVERFAEQGYAAVAPDLFSGWGRFTCVRRAMQSMQTGEGPVVDQVRAARAWLCAETGLEPAHVGLIGFCWGGGFALAAGRGWGAVSSNYGDVPKDAALAGLGPTIACFGGKDRIFGGGAEKLAARLPALGVPVETHVFPEVGHSFLTYKPGQHPVVAALTFPLMHMNFDAASQDEGWRRIFAYFDKHL